jgi:DNA polymerase (family 10)
MAAMKMELEYIVITDHTKRLAMTNGLDARRVVQQGKEIDKINSRFRAKGLGFRVLKGSECDILKDGSMDLPDEVLKQLDVVGASVHSLFNLPEKEQTERIKKAMKNLHVDILFHPTGRLINRRAPYVLDMDEIIKTAKETGTILEIDAFPDRLDIKDEYIRKCVKAGVKMSIDSDAHDDKHFSVLEHGIAQARRGWCEKQDIINTWPAEKMLKMLK